MCISAVTKIKSSLLEKIKFHIDSWHRCVNSLLLLCQNTLSKGTSLSALVQIHYFYYNTISFIRFISVHSAFFVTIYNFNRLCTIKKNLIRLE